jgi:hypothetical protein
MMDIKKKNLFFNLIFLVFTTLLLNGCGSDPVQDDLINYINNQVPKIVPLEAEIMDEYSSVTGENYKDDPTMLKVLQTLRPKCRRMLTILEEEITPKTAEVRKIHELYIDAYNNYYNAFLLIELAIEKADPAIIVKANEKLDKARKLQRDWLSDLNELKRKHNVVTE